MSMLAHGYGIAASGSPNIVFSNVIWGYLVRALPSVAGVDGYSIATLGVLVLVGAVILHGLTRLGSHWLTATAAVMLLLVRPVLFPQFTVNAGLLAVAGLVCLAVHARQRSPLALWCGVVLLFFSYLIRSQELMLVLAVASPLLGWLIPQSSRLRPRSLRWSGGLTRIDAHWVALGTLALLMLIAGWLDWHAYQAADWQAFRELNLSRAPYTDFGAAQSLLQRPELLARYGYSSNDLTLISRWFFVDPALANPDALTAMLADAGFVLVRESGLQSGWKGVQTLLHPVLLPLLIPAVALALLRPNMRVGLAWLVSIGAMFALGFVGRPGVIRVYVPVLSLLLIAPLLAQSTSRRSSHIITALLLTAAGFAAVNAVTASQATRVQDMLMRQNLRALPHGSVASWGSTFPLEAAYPVLGRTAGNHHYRLYSLGAFTLVPNSVAASQTRAGRGLVARFKQPDGLTLFGNDQLFDLLDVYCRERLHGTPMILQNWQSANLHVTRRRCVQQ
ncbi:hypothetical protein NYR97_11955 [Xanthomonas hydrangeae]|uniref:Glycosyltransferase RgtA/B/C/D-like domain-containing protein n=1 Tax=Xanthomonas hydrangeae TaxID=2775159 RepID=A0AAU0B736_9XANT|nr:hypothetical protein [Xanthomonas hydrangeae]WOB48003.1 hypothetical protein NYR97_11955 [Xanthomonas hydrangeae]